MPKGSKTWQEVPADRVGAVNIAAKALDALGA